MYEKTIALYKDHKVSLWIIVACIVLIFVTVSWRANVASYTVGSTGIGRDLQRVGEYQQSAIKRIDVVEAGLNREQAEIRGVSETIGNVEDRVDTSKGRLEQSQRYIGRGKEIIREIRERNKGN